MTLSPTGDYGMSGNKTNHIAVAQQPADTYATNT
jgi:hypothetical protein